MLPPLLALDELQLPLPCSKSVWSADKDQWQHMRDSNNLQLSEVNPSVCASLAGVAAEPMAPSALDESSQLGVLLASHSQYASIRSLAKAIQNPQASLYSDLADALQQSLDAVINNYLVVTEVKSDMHLGTCKAAARLVRILSLAPQRLLFPFSRWQTTALGSQNARNELAALLNCNTSQARLCAYDAGQLLALARMQSCLIHVDPFLVLISTIYLCAYTDLVASSLPLSSTPDPSQRTVIRIDKTLDDHELMEWVTHGGSRRPHVTGVGLLGTPSNQRKQVKTGFGTVSDA
jgi:hypothetical protein